MTLHRMTLCEGSLGLEHPNGGENAIDHTDRAHRIEAGDGQGLSAFQLPVDLLEQGDQIVVCARGHRSEGEQVKGQIHRGSTRQTFDSSQRVAGKKRHQRHGIGIRAARAPEVPSQSLAASPATG